MAPGASSAASSFAGLGSGSCMRRGDCHDSRSLKEKDMKSNKNYSQEQAFR